MRLTKNSGFSGKTRSDRSGPSCSQTGCTQLTKTERGPTSTSGPSIFSMSPNRAIASGKSNFSSPLAAARPLTIRSWPEALKAKGSRRAGRMAISRHAYSLIALPDSPEFAQAVRHRIHGTLYHLQGTAKPREHRAEGTNFTSVSSRCLHGASSVAKLHSVQVNADRRDDDTWLTWLSPLPRLTGSSGAGKPQALRSAPITRCS